MCGICVVWTNTNHIAHLKAIEALRPRGPDAVQTKFLAIAAADNNYVTVGFTRLHIQGSTTDAEQPFCLSDGSLVVCNGEIFNSDKLIKSLGLVVPDGASDCAVIPALLERGMPLAEVARQLDGDFAIVYVNNTTGQIQGCRDPYGVRPLFYGGTCFASEIKGLVLTEGKSGLVLTEGKSGLVLTEGKSGLVLTEGSDKDTVCAVEPGTVLTIDLKNGSETTEVWHQPPWLKDPHLDNKFDGVTLALTSLYRSLEDAVFKRLVTVREIGACLSGGLDSSLVAALAARRLTASRLHTYSIGMEGSPDLIAARLVAAHIGSIHHERIVTAEECLAIIPEVVRAIESFDITTVRASVGNYLVGQLVATETPDVKVVLNGDGADEILGGYLYMRAAPDDAAFETETTRLLTEIHRYDVLRSERSMAAHGLESRSPFLDRQFVSVARSLPTWMLRPKPDGIEKNILRLAFATSGLLPDTVLWRRKEAFSDGISRAENSWFESAKRKGEEMAGLHEKALGYEINPPQTAEALWYRELFHQSYPLAAAATIPAMWMPRFVKGATDPSARTLALYKT